MACAAVLCVSVLCVPVLCVCVCVCLCLCVLFFFEVMPQTLPMYFCFSVASSTASSTHARLQAMLAHEGNKFLIDGFPRNADNFDGWHSRMGDKVDARFVLFLDCDEKVSDKRTLNLRCMFHKAYCACLHACIHPSPSIPDTPVSLTDVDRAVPAACTEQRPRG